MTVNWATTKLSVWLSGTGTKPESKPLTRGEQGVFKDDWVTVWFFCLKVKITVSPGSALTNSGS